MPPQEFPADSGKPQMEIITSLSAAFLNLREILLLVPSLDF